MFYGGAAGGGKSVALLMAALQYSDVPGYDALLLRPSLIELQLAGGLIELAHDWLAPTKARWSGETKTWRFPGRGKSGAGGATLTFGYLADAGDVRRYAGSSLLDDRLRRAHPLRGAPLPAHAPRPAPGNQRHAARRRPATAPRLADVPVRLRATSNPGGPGHQLGQEPLRRPHHPRTAASSTCQAGSPTTRTSTRPPTSTRSPSSRPPSANGCCMATGRSPTTASSSSATGSPSSSPTSSPPATPARCATGTSPRPSPAPPTPTPTGRSGSSSSTTDRAAPTTSQTSSANARPPARSNGSSPKPPNATAATPRS